MTNASEQVELEALEFKRVRAAEYLELMKPRLNSLVLMSTFVAFYLAVIDSVDLLLLIHTLAGTFLIAGGASALNQVWERENDALMDRTRGRPLPSGRIEPVNAAIFGIALGVIGCLYLGLAVNPLTSLVGFLTLALYVFAYTPMKSRSTWNTLVGAVSGALPPVMGWTAVRNEIGIEAGALFGILFFWQLPHFFALSWKLRADYARGGFKMVSGKDKDGALSGLLMWVCSALLLPVSLGLTFTGLTGNIYLAGSVGLGLAYLGYSLAFARHKTDQAARKVFLMSLIYLPTLMILMMADKLT